jgi:uncharacterized protein YkwD
MNMQPAPFARLSKHPIFLAAAGWLIWLSVAAACVPAPAVKAQDAAPLETSQPTHTLTAAPSPTLPTATTTAAVTSLPPDPPVSSANTVTAVLNANCRGGPSTAFDVQGSLWIGDSAALLGRTADGQWLLVLPQESENSCWVFAELVKLDGDMSVEQASIAAAPPTPTPLPSAADASPDQYAEILFHLINRTRAEKGLRQLTLNPILSAAAQAHSHDMAVNDYFSHTGSDGSDPTSRLVNQGYQFTYNGENLFAGGDPYLAMSMWMNSTVHRENMLYPLFTEFGIGIASNPNSTYGIYYTIEFGQP